MKFLIRKFAYFLLLVTVIATSCNTIRQSRFSRDNIIRNGFYNYYFNNSLKLSIQFFGGHRPVNPPLMNYKKFTSSTIKKYLKKEFKKSEKSKILFYSNSPWKKFFGFTYVGFLRKHSRTENTYIRHTSINNSVFFEKTGIVQIDSFLLKKYIIPLGTYDLLFYCFKKILNDKVSDSSILQSDTFSELMTLKTTSNYQPAYKTKKNFSDSVMLSLEKPGYGAVLNGLLTLKSETKSKDNFEILDQNLFTAYSFFDEIDTIKQLLFIKHTFKGNNIKQRTLDTVLVNNQFAIPKILEEAGRQKVMMINESHYDWRHRYFVTLMLDSLFKKGYKYLCMEALNEKNNINKRGFATKDDGIYMKEPFMANLANTALRIGYKLIAYEDTVLEQDVSLFNSPIDKREYYQALNLYTQYKKDTSAKWLVYAGYSHINKSSFSETESSTMAKYFHEFSNINPFSINQSVYSDIFSSKVAVNTSSNRENYYYLRNDQLYDSTLLNQSDLYVINNIDSIPYEMHRVEGFQQYNIHYNLTNNGKDIYSIQVFLKGNYLQNRQAVPIYIKRISENILNKSIWLPENNYYLIVADKNDKILYETDL